MKYTQKSYSTIEEDFNDEVIGNSLFHASASKSKTAFFMSFVISAYN